VTPIAGAFDAIAQIPWFLAVSQERQRAQCTNEERFPKPDIVGSCPSPAPFSKSWRSSATSSTPFDSIKRRAEARPVWLGLRRKLLELHGVCAGRQLDGADLSAIRARQAGGGSRPWPADRLGQPLYVGYTGGTVVIYEVNSGQQVGGFGIGVRDTRGIAVR
jgi:hypothetical protein